MNYHLKTGILGLAVLLSSTAITASHAEAFFGVSSHMLNVSRFFPEKDNTWEAKNVTAKMQSLGVKTVREAVFAYTAPTRAVVTDKANPTPAELKNIRLNRDAVHERLDAYDKAKVEVVLCVMSVPISTKTGPVMNASMREFVDEILTRHPSIKAVELHNEPNLGSFWKSTPEDYVATYRPLALEVKAKHPDVKVLVGSLSSTWWGKTFMIKAMRVGLLDFADGVSVHPYNVKMPPEVDPIYVTWDPNTDKNHNERSLQAFVDFLKPYNKTGKPLALYFTELGFSSSQDGFDNVKQADYLTRSMMIYMNMNLSGVPVNSVYWYDLKNDGKDPVNPEHNYGLFTQDFATAKPAAIAYRKVTQFIPTPDKLELLKNVTVTADKMNMAGFKSFQWQRKGSKEILIPFWRFDMVQKTDVMTTLKLGGLKANKIARIQLVSLANASQAQVLPIGTDSNGDAAVSVSVLRPAQLLRISLK